MMKIEWTGHRCDYRHGYCFFGEYQRRLEISLKKKITNATGPPSLSPFYPLNNKKKRITSVLIQVFYVYIFKCHLIFTVKKVDDEHFKHPPFFPVKKNRKRFPNTIINSQL